MNGLRFQLNKFGERTSFTGDKSPAHQNAPVNMQRSASPSMSLRPLIREADADTESNYEYTIPEANAGTKQQNGIPAAHQLQEAMGSPVFFPGAGTTTPHEKNDRRASNLKPLIIDQKFLRLVVPGLARFVITLILAAGFYALVWFNKNKVISSKTRDTFGTLVIVLSIALGLNVASSLAEVALDVRWWLLSFRKRTPEEVGSILEEGTWNERANRCVRLT